MDEEKFLRAIAGLRWEARYVKRAKGEDPQDYFMAEIETLDENLANALRNGSIRGETLLDVGTGVGWQAIRMAELGFRVTGTDVSTFSLNQAAKNAEKSGTSVEFLKDNALCTSLARKFDIVVDRGCFAGQHAKFFNDYVDNIAKLVKPDGHYLLTIPTGNEEPKLALLAEKFVTIRTAKSFYFGPKGQKWDTLFIHFRPVGASVSAPEGPERTTRPPSSTST